MFNRFSPCAILVYLGVLAAAFGQSSNQGLSFLLQQPGPSSSSGSFTAFLDSANPLNPFATTTGPAGFGYSIAKPSGTGFYLIGPGVIESIDGAFATAPRIVSGLPGPPTAATITPDGKLLLVGATDAGNNGFLFLIDTTTDQVIGSGIPLSSSPNFVPGTNGFCPQCFIAVSEDSKTAYVLTNSGVGARVAAINLVNRTTPNPALILTGSGSSLTMSPLGLLYVTSGNAIYEINPATLQLTAGGTISVFFTPYRLHFTPDGTTAYAVNMIPTQGGSLIKVTLASHQAITWPPFQQGVIPPTFDDVIVAGNNRIFAFTSPQNANGGPTLVDVSVNPFAATPSLLAAGPNNTQFTILAAAASNEIPLAKYFFVLVANGNQTNLYRYNLATSLLDLQNPNVANLPLMQVVTVPPQTGAASFVAYNTNQVLNTGGAAATLIARVYDANGLPVFNAQAAFTTDPTNNAVITNASQTTTSDGYVQASVTVPNVSGTYNITLTVNNATQVFTITVPGVSTGPGGNSQVSIAAGDGQIVIQNQTSTYPLTILVTDTNGAPMANVGVTFALTTGAGFLSTPQTQTDSNGLASSYFTGLQLTVNSTILPVVINASTQFGAVDFHENIMLISVVDGTGIPQIDILQPSFESNRTITAPQGTPLKDAIVASIHATAFPQTGQPIPNIGIFTYNSQDPTQPPVAVCQPNLSDSDGLAKCTLVASCQIGSFPLGIAFGHPFFGRDVEINIVAGGPTKFTIIGGANLTGKAGDTVSGLTAVLSDGCGSNVPVNTPVVWAITGGSGTLVNTSSKTDFQGRVSTGVKLGSTPGPITITVTAGTVKATFTVTNSVIVSGITLVSGTPQVAKTGQAFAQPLVFVVKDNNGGGLSGINVTFTVSGNATVNPGSATTDNTGRAQTTVTAGSVPGNIVVTASAAGFSASANLSSQLPGPNITSASFTNAAAITAIGLVPCGLGTVTGAGVAPSISGIVSVVNGFGPFPFILGGLSMTINGVQAPIQAVSNQNGVQQANFQTPCEISPGTATIVVNVNGSITQVSNVPVLTAQPGVFTFQGANGSFYGAVFRASTGEYVTPTNFAHRGETYYLVATGLGQTSPAGITDSAGVPNQNVLLNTIVGVNRVGVPVVSSQYVQGQIGIYIIGFQIPLNAPTGPDQSLALAVTLNGTNVFTNQTNLLLGGVQ
jgi:uncharacterized protein (TIGR03437 family)